MQEKVGDTEQIKERMIIALLALNDTKGVIGEEVTMTPTIETMDDRETANLIIMLHEISHITNANKPKIHRIHQHDYLFPGTAASGVGTLIVTCSGTGIME